MRESSRAIKSIYWLLFADAITMGISTITLQKSLDPATMDYHAKAGWQHSAAQMLGLMIFSRLSDKIGRRKIILSAFLWIAVGFYFLARNTNEDAIVLIRTIMGLAGCTISLLESSLSDTTTERTRSRRMGLFGATIGLGFTLGIALYVIFEKCKWNLQTNFLFCSGILLFATAMGFIFFPETNNVSQQSLSHSQNAETVYEDDTIERIATSTSPSPTLPSNRDPLMTANEIPTDLSALEHKTRKKAIWTFALIRFLSYASTFFIMHFHRRVTVTCFNTTTNIASSFSQFLLIDSIWKCVIQGGLFSRLSKRFGLLRIYTIGLIAQCLGVLLFLFTLKFQFRNHYILHLLTYCVGYSICEPGIAAAVSFFAGKESKQGEAHGKITSARFLSSIIFGAILNWVLVVIKTGPQPEVPDKAKIPHIDRTYLSLIVVVVSLTGLLALPLLLITIKKYTAILCELGVANGWKCEFSGDRTLPAKLPYHISAQNSFKGSTKVAAEPSNKSIIPIHPPIE